MGLRRIPQHEQQTAQESGRHTTPRPGHTTPRPGHAALQRGHPDPRRDRSIPWPTPGHASGRFRPPRTSANPTRAATTISPSPITHHAPAGRPSPDPAASSLAAVSSTGTEE